MVGSGCSSVLAVQGLTTHWPVFGWCSSFHQEAVLFTLLLLSAWRPAGGGQLVALARSLDGPRTDLKRGVLALEVVAVVLFLAGLFVTVLFGHVIDECIPVVMDETYSIAGATGIADPNLLLGHLGVAAMWTGLLLWGASWVAEGLSLGRNRPWRDG